MNLQTKLLILFLLTGFIFSSLAQDCKGLLIINSDIDDSEIYINDKPAGKGNLKIELEPGVYNITVKEENKIWNGKSFSEKVIIEECNHQTLNFNFNDEIYLDTNPQDAAVFSNDSLIGYTPLYIAGSLNNLQLKKPGYASKSISLTNYNEDVPVSLDFTGTTKELSFYEKDLFKYLLAGIVVLGGTTAYFKLKADKKFEEYENTGDPALLKKTEEYDLISGITFTALQVNFGVLIYFFLNE